MSLCVALVFAAIAGARLGRERPGGGRHDPDPLGSRRVKFPVGVGLLLVSSRLLEHSATRSGFNQVVCVVALLCGVATVDRRRRGARTAGNQALVVGLI
jgi:hypothetical protein